ncbi:TolC family protein [Planctomicrobium sp. SH664]|uniref:TolC family protein n=1 Tax=Planctomicrobium sp. SH664 TaxID=3448125 RepID=UPI003F5B8A2D
MLACGLLLLLTSCSIPQHRLAECGRDLPDTFNGEVSYDNSAQIRIEEFFNDPTLTCLMYEGLAGNQELKILAEEIQIANSEIVRRRGAYLPFVTAGARAGLDKPSFYTPLGAAEEQLLAPNGRGFPSPLPDFMIGTQVSWQIDIWKQLRNARDAATLRYLGTWEGRNYMVTRLIAEIAENYYSLLALDQRLQTLDTTIALQERSLEIAKASKEGARGTELPVQRFLAEVRKNQSEKLIIRQEIIEVENRINFLAGRFPQHVDRDGRDFFTLNLQTLRLGVPAQLLQNRPDIRQAERELAAAGLDVRVARADFYPKLNITAGVGYEAFNPRYLVVTPESLVYNVAGDLVAPVLNRSAIKADYMAANAEQLKKVYNYQQVILNSFTEVINRISMVQNYTASIELKTRQLEALEASVDAASKLFNAARIDYLDVLFAQRDLMDARMALIETKRQQLSAIVNAYQALGGGLGTIEFSSWSYVPVDPFSQPTTSADGEIPICPPRLPEFIEPTPTIPPVSGPALIPPAPDQQPQAPPGVTSEPAPTPAEEKGEEPLSVPGTPPAP